MVTKVVLHNHLLFMLATGELSPLDGFIHSSSPSIATSSGFMPDMKEVEREQASLSSQEAWLV